MRAAIHFARRLNAVADNAAVAVRTCGRKGLDRALEAVEGHGPAALRNAHGFVVVVSANVAARHWGSPGRTHIWPGGTHMGLWRHQSPAAAKVPATLTGVRAAGRGKPAPDRQAPSAAAIGRQAAPAVL